MPDPAKRGLFKIKMGFITQHSVRMMFEPYGPFEVAEDHYRQEGYEPEFDRLPWQDEQDATLAAPAGDSGNEVRTEFDEFEPADAALPATHKQGWLEQSIAKLAVSRFSRQSPK